MTTEKYGATKKPVNQTTSSIEKTGILESNDDEQEEPSKADDESLNEQDKTQQEE